MKQTICSMVEDLVKLTIKIEDRDLGVEFIDYLIKIKKAGQAMENRLKRYRKSIERLGFRRV